MSVGSHLRLIALSTIGIVVIALVAVSVLFVGRDDDATPSDQPELTIAIAVQDDVFPTLVYVAHDRGYFVDEGIPVKLRSFPSAKMALRTVLAGESHMATTSGVPIAVQTLGGAPVSMLCTVAFTDRAFRVVARRDRGIERPTDLVGKRVAAQEGSAEHFFLDVFLGYHGIDPSDVEIAFMPPVEMPDALVEGRVDAFAMRQPFIGEALAGLNRRGVVFEAPDHYRAYFALVASPNFVEQNPGRVEAVLRGLVRAEQLLRSDPEAALDSVVRQLGEARRSEVEEAWNEYRFEVAAGQSFLLNLESEARWVMREIEGLRGPMPDYLDMFDTEPLLRVRPESVTVLK
jgi:ABC-type nitrate/sulfonate/bicarbonate transport system substrate-binding protein